MYAKNIAQCPGINFMKVGNYVVVANHSWVELYYWWTMEKKILFEHHMVCRPNVYSPNMAASLLWCKGLYMLEDAQSYRSLATHAAGERYCPQSNATLNSKYTNVYIERKQSPYATEAWFWCYIGNCNLY